MKVKTKITLTAIISVILTFALTSVFYLGIGSRALSRIATSQNSSGQLLLNEVKLYLESVYLGEIDDDALYQNAAKGMASALGDPYTNYYTPKEFKEYMENAVGAYVGVGIVLSATVDTNEIVVVLPYKDAPGDKAGVLPGDIITAIDGVYYTGDALDEAADAMRGAALENPVGTSVKVSIKRGEEIFDVTLVREEVHLVTTDSKMLEDGIGYMRIISFDSDTNLEVENELKKLEDGGMKKLILDLRDNGGGDFNTAIDVAGLFLDEGALVTYTQNKSEERHYFYAKKKKTDCELIVLVNNNSASASEVVTGALKDNGRLKSLIGTKTYGKGITQNIYTLSGGGGMSITVDRYYTPSGECIHEKGIEPDKVVSLGENDNVPSTTLEYEQDLQLIEAVKMFK